VRLLLGDTDRREKFGGEIAASRSSPTNLDRSAAGGI
jgi:hypothetical protein